MAEESTTEVINTFDASGKPVQTTDSSNAAALEGEEPTALLRAKEENKNKQNLVASGANSGSRPVDMRAELSEKERRAKQTKEWRQNL